MAGPVAAASQGGHLFDGDAGPLLDPGRRHQLHHPAGAELPHCRVTFQYHETGSTVWKFLKSVTTNKTGQAAYTYYPNKTRTYRAYVPQNATLWDYYTVAISR